jgi:hypothetical protein
MQGEFSPLFVELTANFSILRRKTYCKLSAICWTFRDELSQYFAGLLMVSCLDISLGVHSAFSQQYFGSFTVNYFGHLTVSCFDILSAQMEAKASLPGFSNFTG